MDVLEVGWHIQNSTPNTQQYLKNERYKSHSISFEVSGASGLLPVEQDSMRTRDCINSKQTLHLE